MTVEKVLQKTIKTIISLRETTNSPVHALLYGNWGVGKSYSAQKVAQRDKGVFYCKIPDGNISKSKLLKIISLSLGAGYRHLYEGTYDLLKYHILVNNYQHPIIILDESQRILKSSLLMSELKDLSEDNQIRFSYIFLGDHTTADIFKAHKHSIHKRILIKEKLQNLTEEIITEIAKEKGLQVDPNIVLEYGKERGWTTIEVAFLFSYLSEVSKVKKIEITKETIQEISKKLWKE